jgi:hypothetical protein
MANHIVQDQGQKLAARSSEEVLAETLAKVASVAGNATIQLTAADITSIITAAIRASKEPSDSEKAKVAADAADEAEKRAQLLAEADEWRTQRDAMRDNCGHKKPRGEDSVIGKLFSDGVYRVMCLRCQKWIAEIVATPEMISQVMQADSLGAS